jgi:hypothetical protein
MYTTAPNTSHYLLICSLVTSACFLFLRYYHTTAIKVRAYILPLVKYLLLISAGIVIFNLLIIVVEQLNGIMHNVLSL